MLPLFSDLKFVMRRLRKSPGFAVTALLTLALGIGATSAVFAIVEAVFLRPLPFVDPQRLVSLGDHLQGADLGAPVDLVTAPEVRAYSRDTHSFELLGGYGRVRYELSSVGGSTLISAARLTATVFPTLGVTPLLGRTFTPEEDEQHQQVAVLSYLSWQRRFHGDPQILGTKILLDRRSYIVIGVMPPNFEFPLISGRLNRCELWVPMSFAHEELTGGGASNWAFAMVGRLRPGVTLGQAQSDAEQAAQAIMRNYPADMASLHIDAIVRPLRAEGVPTSGPVLTILFLAVAVVLLIACANLAGLLLVRGLQRQREIALRIALGASTAALIGEIIVESLTLSLGGGLLGVALAAAALQVGKALLPESVPRVAEIGVNGMVVGFALLLAVITGLFCGLAPLFAALRTNMNDTLKEGGRSGSVSASHARLRSALVVGEIAVALLLLAASGLLLRSFKKMQSADLGFRPEHIATAKYSLPRSQYGTQKAVDAFNKELLLRLSRVSGIQPPGLTVQLPTAGNGDNETFVAEGYFPPPGSNLNLAVPSLVMGDFFRAMGIPLLRGRVFTQVDREGAPLVVIVNRKLANRCWPNQDPIGKRLRIGTPEMRTPWLTVVGEVADVQLYSPDTEATEQFYQPIDQAKESLGSLASPGDLNGNRGYIVLRSSAAPERMVNVLRATVRSIDPVLPLTQVLPMNQVVSESEASRRFNTTLIASFGFTALVLAALGIYSVLAFSVATRGQEIAIRMALGSTRSGILRLIVTSGAKMAAIGCLMGLVAGVAAAGALRSLLFGVSPFDPLVLTLSATAVLSVAVGVSALPAIRAASVDPVQAMRGN
jgi:predicted permease